MTLVPAYTNVGSTAMHAAPAGAPSTVTDAICGATFVIRSRGSFAAAALARGPLTTYCNTCLRAAVAALA